MDYNQCTGVNSCASIWNLIRYIVQYLETDARLIMGLPNADFSLPPKSNISADFTLPPNAGFPKQSAMPAPTGSTMALSNHDVYWGCQQKASVPNEIDTCFDNAR
jgi:hypothetical protein